MYAHAVGIDMMLNVQKAVAMVFSPKRRAMVVAKEFPLFKVDDKCIQYVEQFKYLGHIITNTLTYDDDINREIKKMFVRTNMLIRKFHNCSTDVKMMLFKTFCICLYDVALWKTFKIGSLNKFRSCYNKCIKLFFSYKRCDSVTNMLLVLGLPSFDTLLHNCGLQLY